MPQTKRIIKKSSGSKGRRVSGGEKRARGGVYAPQTSGRAVARGATGSAGTIVCPECRSVYYDKHWHTRSAASGIDIGAAAQQLCEECTWKKKRGAASSPAYAGELLIDGDFTPSEREEVMGLIRNVGSRAMRRDPEHRIVRIAEAGGKLRVFVSENQLAVAIGKQLNRAHKGGELTITWSHDDKPVRVLWSKR